MARTTRKTPKPTKARKTAKKTAAPEATSKQAMLIEMLKSEAGVTVAEIAKALHWQPHTVRGAISGALRKRLGLDVTSEMIDGRGRVYRIAN